MEEEQRKAFESVTFHSFVGRSLLRFQNGEYADVLVEDHWQSFQEGWEAALEYDRQKGLL